MTAVLTSPEAPVLSRREEALADDVHFAERRAIESERVRHEAVRRMHQAQTDAETYRQALAGSQEELIALRLRERELEATNGMLLRLLARESRGLNRQQIPEFVGEPGRYLVIKSLANRPSSRVGQQGDSFEVNGRGDGALLFLRFADGEVECFTPAELILL